MGNSFPEVEQDLSYACNAKVHGVLCKELTNFVERICRILPDIESSRPGCMSGIQALCSLNHAITNAKLLLQHCAESSKLYLAVTGESITSRCERIRNSFDKCLSQIQTMVPQRLAAQISEIVDDIKGAKFVMESSEEETGRLVRALCQQDKSAGNLTESSEFQAFQIAAETLHITSPKALLIEKRSLKKLLDKVRVRDTKKESTVLYLLDLLQKYGELVKNADAHRKESLSSANSECNKQVCERYNKFTEAKLLEKLGSDESQTDISSTLVPPEEFKCPISSKLMHDPVLIASGRTYERIWIQKWFNEGHDTCPKTQEKLQNLSMTPNLCVKDLISNWCIKHGISIPDPCSLPSQEPFCSWDTSDSSFITSFDRSIKSVPSLLLNGEHAEYINQSDTSFASVSSSDTCNYSDSSSLKYDHSRIFGWNDEDHTSESFPNCTHEIYSRFLTHLASRPLESQSKALEDIKSLLREHDEACYHMLSNGFLEVLMSFLKDSQKVSDLKAQKAGLLALAAFISSSRADVAFLSEDVCEILASSLDSELAEVGLEIMQILSSLSCYKSKIVHFGAVPSIIKILDSLAGDSLAHAIKILHDLSSMDGIGSHMRSPKCISKLATTLLGDRKIAGNSIKIMRYLTDTKGSRASIAEADGCIAAIVELVETGDHEDQENAVAVLLSLCLDSSDHCELVMKEGVIPSLVSVSVNGNRSGRDGAMKLLQLLRDRRESYSSDSFTSQSSSDSGLSQDLESYCKEKTPASTKSGGIGRKIGFFSKPRSIPFFLGRRVENSF